MKLKLFIPPVIALVLAAGWLGGRRQVLNAVEKENSMFRAELRTFQANTSDNSSHTAPTAPLDWKALSFQAMKLNRTGLGGAALRKRFDAMSKEEIVSSLEQISKLDPGPKSVLREMLTVALLKKDPGFALSLFAGTIEEERIHFLASGLKDWALATPTAAAAWFDQQLENGTFASKRIDGFSRLKNEMEPALISALISSAPEVAVRRLSAIPEEDRVKLLYPYASEKLSEEQQISFASMVREILPASAARRLLNDQCAVLAARDGYQAASDYFKRINATSEERDACVDYSVGRSLTSRTQAAQITIKDVEELRAWVDSEVPSATDRATGSALGRISHDDYARAATLAASFHDRTGNDDILISFFQQSDSHSHLSEARKLAEKFMKEETRKEALEWLDRE